MSQLDLFAGRTPARTVINIAIIVLAVIGAIAIFGWVVSALLWLVRLALFAGLVVLILVLVKLVARGGRP